MVSSSSRVTHFVHSFRLLSLPVSRYKNLGHRMESWDIAYEPRTGRCNHRASFFHLSSFLRFVFSFSSWRRNTNRESLSTIPFGESLACESIELKCLRILKVSLRWRSVRKRSKVFFFFRLTLDTSNCEMITSTRDFS